MDEQVTSPDSFRLCLVGLPATGKTTYIAALWSYLTSGPPEGTYRVTQYPDDPSYLNAIAEAWVGGESMPRNSLGSTDRIEFTIETPARRVLTIVLPDLPGELFLNAVVRPWIDEDTAQAVTGSDLLLVFVNGEKAKTYSALGDQELPHHEPATNEAPVGARSDSADPAQESGAGSAPQSPDIATSVDFSVEGLDSDTLNTELVQRLVYLTTEDGTPPILVVVSAWDSLHDPGERPEAWLRREQPMLAQLVEELRLTTQVGVVGVSAQGANYKADPAIIQKLAGDRPWGCDSEGNRGDVTGPLTWFDGLGVSPRSV
ncbi:MAG: TRAFAC clade GTPase domain-containing protein [Gaiellaceae bacterium]